MSEHAGNVISSKSAIKRGIDYLYHHQMANGEFLFYMSGDDEMKGWINPESAIFPTALAGWCLWPLRRMKQVEEILQKSAAFLKSQQGVGGTWSHHAFQHRLYGICPQDADDTALVSIFLEKMGVDFYSDLNKKMLLQNRNREGLFFTWFIFRPLPNKNKYYWILALKELKWLYRSLLFWRHTEASRFDVDMVVNSNVLYYLGNNSDTKPVIRRMIKTIERGDEKQCDTWYLNPFSVYYFFSRNFEAGMIELEPIRKPIINRILARLDESGRIGRCALETALGLSTLVQLRFGERDILQKSSNFLITQQRDHGNWDRWIFYYGGPKKAGGYGSEEVTTTLCVEALYKTTNWLNELEKNS